VSPTQQVWTSCWAGLVHAGWCELVVARHLKRWVVKVCTHRGWVWTAKALKKLCHAVRASSMRSRYELPEDIPRDISRTLTSLAWKNSRDGFAFSRCARSFPLGPPSGEEVALRSARELATTVHTTPGWALESIRKFILSRKRRGGFPKGTRVLPSSSSSCHELSGAHGGTNAYFRQLGESVIDRVVSADRSRRSDPEAMLADLLPYCQDSLGTFCARKVRGDGTLAVADEETVRALGVLEARRLRPRAVETKATVIREQGMKYRVVGVPSALVFMEGTWIRQSCNMLPREHFVPRDGTTVPPGLSAGAGQGWFVSVDLSKATDGIGLDAVEAVIDALHEARFIRPADVDKAKWGMGVDPMTKWTSSIGDWISRRGSPMGTPLSFVVLSWINAWACQGFSNVATHGDDAVGLANSYHEVDDYNLAVSSIGASLNMTKTFVSRTRATMCEFAILPSARTSKGTVVPFYPPSCPGPGVRAPWAADPRVPNRYLRRAERVVRAFFPWSVRDPRVRLPLEVGGLGYTGRGLAVSKAVRCRLAAACSRGSDVELSAALSAKRPFREEGLYPKSMVRVPLRPKSFYKACRAVDRSEDFHLKPAGQGVSVPLSKVIAAKARQAEELYTFLGGKTKRVVDKGRPAKTKTSTLFRTPQVPSIRPLSKANGVWALKRLASKLAALEVRIDEDIAHSILGYRIESPCAPHGGQGGVGNHSSP